jgi:hypothetical protein
VRSAGTHPASEAPAAHDVATTSSRGFERPRAARAGDALLISRPTSATVRAVATAALAAALAVPGVLWAFPLRAIDTPNDSGRSITLTWTLPATTPAQWTIVRRKAPNGAFAPIATLEGSTSEYQDSGDGVSDGVPYQYQVIAVPDDPALRSDVSAPVASNPDWFDRTKTNVAVVLVIFFIVLFYYIAQAHKGVRWTFRRIAGLDAIEEAVGRATEMGKGILYIPGVQDIDDIQTIASMILLGNVARTAAKYETPLQVPTNSPAVYTVAEEVVKSAYQDVGRADAYRADQVRYITTEQFAYVAAVNGIMLRERPAANLLLGAFFAESLLLAETGHSVGAIQIAGTANVHQMPFFVVACDYTLIGEEYYAASALLSNDSRLLGSLKSSDTVKIILIAVIVVGSILTSSGFLAFAAWWATTQ